MNGSVAPASTKRTGGCSVARERSSYDRGDFTWRRHQDGSWARHVEGRRGAVLHVVRDQTYPQMWRIRHLDGRLFDMVNLSRAKDAAISVTLCILNRSRESTPVPSPMGETGLPVALVTSTPEPAPEPAL